MLKINPSNSFAIESSDCLCFGFFSQEINYATLNILAKEQKSMVKAVINSKDFSAKSDESFLINLPDSSIKRVILFGLGDSTSFSLKQMKKNLNSLSKTLNKLHLKSINIIVNDVESSVESDLLYRFVARQMVEQSYSIHSFSLKHGLENMFAQLENKEKLSSTLDITYHSKFDIEKPLQLGYSIGEGINTTRFLGDLPSNVCTPSFLASFSLKLAKEHSDIEVNVLDEADMEKLGMHSFLSVTSGSKEVAKLIEIKYKTNNTTKKPTVLVGKGVTFDTGGISLKPGAKMDEMKYDMCGAASAIGTMQAIADSNCIDDPVIAIIPATENMPSSTATKPGDVVKSYSGQTIEILNTDAEGRLILADALSYAEEKYQPKAMVNMATLTGACIIALGNYRSALMANDSNLAQALMEAGQEALDPCWQLPLDDEYDQLLQSNFADMANLGNRTAGSITAGCFLQRFVKKTPWAHLDIAGVAWLEGNEKGATGRPVPLLFTWILNQHEN